MKKFLIASLALNLLAIVAAAVAAIQLPGAIERFTAANAERRVTQFEILGGPKGSVVFVGDSITQGGLWGELFANPRVLNRGIGGDATQDLLNRADQIHALSPRKLFLMIGINDLNQGVELETTFSNLEGLFDGFDRELPKSRVYLQSVLPVNEDWFRPIDPADVEAINEKLRAEADARGYQFVDLRPLFSDENGQLKRDYSNDGIHLLGGAYAVWRDRIEELVRE